MLVRIAVMGVLMLCVSSCTNKDRITSRRNKVLSTFPYNSTEYQAELYKLIKEHPDVDYYFEMREELEGQHYLVVNAYGDAFCGKLCLMIHEDDIASVQLQSETGYHGAQLIGLRFTQDKSLLGNTLVYQSLEYIVD